MKVLLITPPYHCGILEVAGRWTPVGFVYLAGQLRAAGHEPVIYDAMTKNHNLSEIVERVRVEKPDMVGMTAFTASFPAAIEVLSAVKEIMPEVVTLLGGVHPSLMVQDVLTNYGQVVDFLIKGEGEEAIVELADLLAAGGDPGSIEGLAFRCDDNVMINRPRCMMSEGHLDALEPAWDLLDWNDYTYFMVPGSTLAVVSSSRGCTAECGFCSQQKFWEGTWRGRSPQRVTQEIKELNRDYGVNVVMFADEYPTKDRTRWEAVLDGLIALNLNLYILMETRVEDIVRDAGLLWKYKKAGVIHIYVGVESATQDGLDRFQKNIKVEQSREALRLLREAGIVSETSFILGTPEETRDSIAYTLEQAIDYDPDFAHFLMLSPWPYADMYEELRPYIISHDLTKYNLIEPVIKPVSMSTKELHKEMLACYRKFYMQKLPKWERMQDNFNRRYLVNSLKEMLASSFLKAHMTGLGKMPAAVERYVQKLLA